MYMYVKGWGGGSLSDRSLTDEVGREGSGVEGPEGSHNTSLLGARLVRVISVAVLMIYNIL